MTQPAPHIGDGWSFQVVPRRIGNQKDTYYFSPSGDRLRSMPEVRRYMERGHVNSAMSSKKRKLGPSQVANADTAPDEGRSSSLELGSERPLKKIPAHRLIVGYKDKKETAGTNIKRRRDDTLIESLEHRRILLRNVKAGRLAAERNLGRKLAGGYALDSASPPTLDPEVRLEREKAVFQVETCTAAELDAPPRLCKLVRRSSDSDEDFEVNQEDEGYGEVSVAPEGLEGFEALVSAAADEEPLIDGGRTAGSRNYKTFESRFEDLRQYKRQHGHLNISREENKSLYTFCDSIRYGRNHPGKNGTKMTDERIKALDAIGFKWSVKRISGTVHRRPKSFASRIEDLKKYKQKHGHLEISVKEDKSLYHFCHNVRTGRKCPDRGMKMTDERVKALDKIGFSWTPSTRGRSMKLYEARFEDKLEDLRQYKQQHGHLNVKIDENKSLYYFCNNVRDGRKYPGKNSMMMTDGRVKALDEIGFQWKRESKSFESKIEDLKKYKQQHGHLVILRKEDKSLFDFCNNVRYGRNNPGKGMKMTDNRVRALDEIGFPWKAHSNESNTAVETNIGRTTVKSTSERILELKRFFDEHGKLPTPQSNKKLSTFCNSLRNKYKHKKDRLSSQDLDTLREIGFRWGSHNKSSSRLNELKLYFEEHGHFDVAKSENARLARYVREIRYAYHNRGAGGNRTAWKISDETISELESMGFTWGARPQSRPRAARQSFESRIEDLKKYKQQHGHLDISLEEDTSLYYFCRNVMAGRKYPGRGMTITDEKIKALDEIGFPWKAIRAVGAEVTSFEDRLDELRKYKHDHGHTNVKWADDISLAAFCSKLRFARKTKRMNRLNLTDAKVAALNSIGFDWCDA